MTIGYSNNHVDILTLPELPENLPYAVDDFSLAMQIGFRNKILWWVLNDIPAQYKVFRIPKKRPGEFRYIHSPSEAMKKMSQRLNERFLNPLQEDLGPHVTAYRPGLGIVDAVNQHVRKCPTCDEATQGITPKAHECPRRGVYIHMDIENFFTRTTRAWIRNYFKGIGYSHMVAGYLASLMTVPNIPNPGYSKARKVPETVAGVPQGAPTSGGICNLVANDKIDVPVLDYIKQLNSRDRLSGEWEWRYSRYSDDLTFTCGWDYPQEDCMRIVKDLTEIIQKSHYRVNRKKTRVVRNYARKKMLGVVFNQKPNFPKREYRLLRAITHNCLKRGFEAEFAKAKQENAPAMVTWLRGKINWVNQINPQRGRRLLEVFNLAVAAHCVEVVHADAI